MARAPSTKEKEETTQRWLKRRCCTHLSSVYKCQNKCSSEEWREERSHFYVVIQFLKSYCISIYIRKGICQRFTVFFFSTIATYRAPVSRFFIGKVGMKLLGPFPLQPVTSRVMRVLLALHTPQDLLWSGCFTQLFLVDG